MVAFAVVDIFEPPHSALYTTFCRSVWTERSPRESAAPLRRIIHARGARLPAPVTLQRLRLRWGRGYFKCGSDPFSRDHVTDARLLVSDGSSWRVALDLGDLDPPPDDGVVWYDLGGHRCRSVLLELRRCAVDGWWPSWNLAMSAPVLEAEWADGAPSLPAPQRLLRLEGLRLEGLPPGVEATQHGGQVRYRTPYFQVGFRLRRAAFSFLALDDEGRSRVDRNLLSNPGYDTYLHPLREHLAQGVRLCPVAGPQVAGTTAHDVEGETSVDGGVVCYEVRAPSHGLSWKLRWTVRAESLSLEATREGDRPVRAWESSLWHMGFDSRVAAVSTLGAITRVGETGLMRGPVVVHAPGFGSLTSTGEGDLHWRADSARPVYVSTVELKLGETPQPEGDTLLEAGRHTCRVVLAARTPVLAHTRAGAPAGVARAVRRCAVTALPYRPDTATLSNNGNSMHAPICMDNWSALATRMSAVAPGVEAHRFLRDSLDRWLDDGQGYASGPAAQKGRSYDDEYVMTPAACLLGIGEYLQRSSDRVWLQARATALGREIERMRRRDLDGDGLIESPYRLGKSGEHQWSTNWFDVVSFGWKDAFTNALLYGALLVLSAELAHLEHHDLAAGLDTWAARLKASYEGAFHNPETGWYAGWRCAEGRLHDWAFLAVNGAAVTTGVVEGESARLALRGLWREMEKLGFDDFRLGLPWNLRRIPDEDMGKWNTARPLGIYANGGVSLSQARHFIGALYRVGMRAEADRVLEAACASLADGSAFGGCASGVDLRTWDGTPCGYEGLLCDQLGVLAVALEHYGA